MGKALLGIIRCLGIAYLLCYALFPFLWMFVTSIKSGPELYANPNPLWVAHPTLTNYEHLLLHTSFVRWLLNSIIVSLCSAVLTLVLSIPSAYAIARIRSTHSTVFGMSAILGYGLSPIMLIVPMFVMATKIGLYDKPWVLILVYPSFLLPFASWLIAGYIKEVPISLEDAAQTDGCNIVGLIYHVILPYIKEGLRATFLFCFLLSWGEYLYALGLISRAEYRTLPVGMASLESGDVYVWGEIMAASFLATIPVIIILLLARKHLPDVLTAGAIKK